MLYVEGSQLVRTDDIQELRNMGVVAVAVQPSTQQPRNYYDSRDLISKIAGIVQQSA